MDQKRPRSDEHMSYFSTALGRIMEARGWTQSALAEKIDATQAMISKYVTATATPDALNLDRICIALGGVDAEELAIAYLRDLIPQSMVKRLDVVALTRAERVIEEPEFYRISKLRPVIDEAAGLGQRLAEAVEKINGLLQLARESAAE